MSFTASTNPTPYGDVNALLHLLLAKVQTILGDKLIGCYLYGSLSLGDFDPESSDIDFLMVTTEELIENVLEELRNMHADIAASGLLYANHLEGSYIPRAALRSYDPHDANHPTIGIDWDFHVGQHGSNWIIERHIVREYGVVVWGPSPKTLIDPVPMQAIKAAVCEMLRTFWKAQLAGSEWLRPRDYQAFAILTMCRALYTLRQGVVASKPEAAAWACQALDPNWRPTIEKALTWRSQHVKDDLSETLAFLRFAIMYSEELCR
ncbi:MAG TPA: aminoglycoside adenylyltransferase domain-containing protein [Ktedonobacteraceae bacterium]|nr:aminoglycoside adenylyltransferase domain-containing protein [Ktedonobacteraceae bacterium]